ncbi:WecB/TagA/CpsF family glycosyltransferase [Curtobacterium sp. TXMA1]|uniref:WecB/TagA/CpsF family glycosyltransferase n=1 Tax=Curtobacterium sp. TXMA1 TaxID=2876939 RepID=UPI001CCA397D|nr:WecB/TagA/CpsF family glycosyltransferase [Curtobacterium sp. TXMA1]UBQ03085.1 WecB/TagA/CpsF family glycosyltransferase [Curtobacterium sp. TXMA1]
MRTIELPGGMTVNPLRAGEVCDIVLEGTTSGFWIANLNLHGMYMYLTARSFKAFSDEAHLCLIDGWPILAFCWMRGHLLSPHFRIGSTDWITKLLKDPRSTGMRVTAVGGTPKAAIATSQRIAHDYPGVTWTSIDGYSDAWDLREDQRDLIRNSNLVLVGMGMPLQEEWILSNKAILKDSIVANVGGAFDYFAGVQALAPRWMGRVGLEWIFRLSRDPKRLANRYLIEPFKLFALLALKREVRR